MYHHNMCFVLFLFKYSSPGQIGQPKHERTSVCYIIISVASSKSSKIYIWSDKRLAHFFVGFLGEKKFISVIDI